MINYILFTTATGEIFNSVMAAADSIDLTYIMTMHPDFDDDTQSYLTVPEFVDPKTNYVLSGVVTPRPLFSSVATFNKTTITADGTDSAVLGPSLPNPTTVQAISSPSGGESTSLTTITDGSLTIKSSIQGFIRISLKAFPYQDELFLVIAE